MMMGGLKGGEGELAADGGGAGPLAVSHSWKRKPLFSEPQCRKTILKPICRVGKTGQGQCRYGEAYFYSDDFQTHRAVF